MTGIHIDTPSQTCVNCQSQILGEAFAWEEGEPLCCPNCHRENKEKIEQGTETGPFAFDDR